VARTIAASRRHICNCVTKCVTIAVDLSGLAETLADPLLQVERESALHATPERALDTEELSS
jgi:hypothetical protein